MHTTHDRPVHEWFGLTYASYLVLPRSMMQSMPTEWQEKMVNLLEELEDRLGHHTEGDGYEVQLVRDGEVVDDPLIHYRRIHLEPKEG